MNKIYNFISDFEPTEEQLKDLMLDVLQDVKARALKAEKKFKAIQEQEIKKALDQWRLRQK